MPFTMRPCGETISSSTVEQIMPIPPFIPVPAIGDSFIGRQGLVRNLRGRITKGGLLAVIGGPKLGKTSLVLTALDGLADRTVLEVDLRTDQSPRLDKVPGSIVVLDNLDDLVDSAIEPLLKRISAAGAANVVATGGRRLRMMLGQSGTLAAMKFRLYPLTNLLDSEMRHLIGRGANPSLAEWTGNHPYLTKLLLHYNRDHGEDDAIEASRPQWEPFLQCLVTEIGKGAEWRLLHYLVKCEKPVNPTKARSDTGIRDIKMVADTLVYLGTISRWIRNEEATLFAGCRLLNDFITAA